MKTFYIFILFQIICSLKGFSQISVSGAPLDDLINEIISGNSISISNVSYSGSLNAIGRFEGSIINMPFQSGLIMTTGYISQITGPNDQDNVGLNNESVITSHLPYMDAGYECFNTAKLEFDFIPTGDSLILEFIFGSDEYPEYVGSIYTDVFGVFLSGFAISDFVSIAKITNGQTITVNHINNGNPGGSPPPTPANPEYYIDNGNGSTPPYNLSDKFIQYDGFTIPIRISTPVVSNQNYHLELAIADVGDQVWDSGVLINAHSLTAGIEDDELANLNIYPNPTSDYLTIETGTETFNINLLDLNGKTLMSQTISGTGTLDLSSFKNGSYLLEINAGKSKIIKKIVKL